ncbi:MAG: hypothetical protein AABY45_06365 [Deltaproteobacteria bacterium]
MRRTLSCAAVTNGCEAQPKQTRSLGNATGFLATLGTGSDNAADGRF